MSELEIRIIPTRGEPVVVRCREAIVCAIDGGSTHKTLAFGPNATAIADAYLEAAIVMQDLLTLANRLSNLEKDREERDAIERALSVLEKLRWK